MKRNMLKKIVVVFSATVMAGAFIAGCGKLSAKPAYIEKGVYYNYAKDDVNPDKTYFYVFVEDDHGHSEDPTNGAGLPFDYVQEDGKIKFRFGGVTEDWDTFEVTSADHGIITGHFKNGREMVFEPVPGVDPATFDGEVFINQQGSSVEDTAE
ncbi:hypothetical protein [Butyrivibrio sp. LC3010]|uniref:hypothetical protein n=1 Tax=Butyrivibrio sp. LC3010 TaxID=1280680 RepID=UPI00042904EB|nr:hypothetical protein [Butyrivibrio sp. LC3010]